MALIDYIDDKIVSKHEYKYVDELINDAKNIDFSTLVSDALLVADELDN